MPKYKRTIVTISSGHKKVTRSINATVLPNGKTIVPRSWVARVLEEMGVQRGQTYSIS